MDTQTPPAFSPDEAFLRWFAASRVVDENGSPQVVHHGTTAGGFDRFCPRFRKHEQLGFGIHFAADKAFAERYAFDLDVARKGKNPQVYSVHLAVQRPLDACAVVTEGDEAFDLARKLAGRKLFTVKDEAGRHTAYMQNAIDATGPERAEHLIRDAGFDGVRYEARIGTRGVGATTTARSKSWIVFSADQIRGALPGMGLFDPSRTHLHQTIESAQQALAFLSNMPNGAKLQRP